MQDKSMYQYMRDKFSLTEEQKKRNEKNAKPGFISGIGLSVANGAGMGALASTVVIAAATSSSLAASVPFIGIPILLPAWIYLARGLRALMSQQSPWLRMPVMFLFHASMSALAGFIGFAILAACTSGLINPFVLPCFIAVAVAGAIVLAASIAVACRTRYIAPDDEPVSKDLPKHIARSIFSLKDDVFSYDLDFPCRDGLVVVPFGKEEPVINTYTDVCYSMGKSLHTLFKGNNNNQQDDVEDESMKLNDCRSNSF